MYAFLDVVYIVCQPERVRVLFDRLAGALTRVAGIRPHDGKTTVWNWPGARPESIADRGPDVWQPRGITVLGTPLGSAEYITEKVERRLADERLLWETIPAVPDLQCAWQTLLQSANPRASHTIRTLPPTMSEHHARGHDERIWATAKNLLSEVQGTAAEQDRAQRLATLPMRMGGLLLRSAARCARAAHWASWVDVLPIREKRNPAIAEMVEHTLAKEAHSKHGSLSEISRAVSDLDQQGFAWQPNWSELRKDKRPPENLSKEPGEWQHGWQCWCSFVADTSFRKSSMLSGQTAANQAHLLSHSRHNAGVALAYAPTAPKYVIPPHLFRVLLLERMRLPLPITDSTCSGCHARLDPRGMHGAACTRSGRIRKLADPIERTLARVFREAGARVRFNVFLRDMNVGVPVGDARRIEVLAQDLPCFGGSQLAVDVTSRSALSCRGEPPTERSRCGWSSPCPGTHGQGDHLSRVGRVWSVPAGGDRHRNGCRWSEEAVDMFRLLAFAKAREAPPAMKWSVVLAWERRWTRMLATTCAVAFAASLVDTGGEAPTLCGLFDDDPRQFWLTKDADGLCHLSLLQKKRQVATAGNVSRRRQKVQTFCSLGSSRVSSTRRRAVRQSDNVEGIHPAPHIHEQMATANYVQMATTLRTPSRITTSRLSTMR